MKMCLFGLLTLALCASLPALADSAGVRCGQDGWQTSYARSMACQGDLPPSISSTASSGYAVHTLSEEGWVRQMDIIGNSGETTPEPSSLILLGGGLLGAFATMRRGLSR